VFNRVAQIFFTRRFEGALVAQNPADVSVGFSKPLGNARNLPVAMLVEGLNFLLVCAPLEPSLLLSQGCRGFGCTRRGGATAYLLNSFAGVADGVGTGCGDVEACHLKTLMVEDVDGGSKQRKNVR
jgi:hypothetical protein